MIWTVVLYLTVDLILVGVGVWFILDMRKMRKRRRILEDGDNE